jgi:hypothetical protein
MRKILIFLSVAASFTSCSSDYLDLKPSTALDTESAITNIADAQVALNGVYDGLQSASYYGAQAIYYPEVAGEDLRSNGDGKRSTTLYRLLTLTPSTSPSGLWSRPYYVQRQATNVIEQIGNIKDGDEADRNNILGQALSLRALALFDLARYFGSTYTKDAGASLGGVNITEAFTASAKPARNTVAENYTQIISDLTKAIPLLSTDVNNGYINQWAAKALLSRVYLYKGDNANALLLAEDIIKNAKSLYSLWPNSDYATIWGTDFSSESLFEVVNSSTDWADREAVSYLLSEDGYDDVVLTNSFVSLLKNNPNDVRNSIYAQSNGTYYLLKYPGKPGDGDVRTNNIVVIRLSEVYLIAAEAAFKSGDKDKAATYVNDIIKRADPSNAGLTSATVSLDLILLERRKELVGEGHRLFDALRNNQTITRTGTDHLPKILESFDRSNYHTILPVPQSEIDANSNIIQNPEYGN